jgi:hypothetical protein
MNLLNLIEDTTTGYENLRALMQAVQNSQDALLNIGGEPVTLTYPEARFMFGKYKAFNQAGRQEEFLNVLGDPVKFDQHMKQLRQLIDKQKNFRGSVPGERGVTGDVPAGVAEETVEEIAMTNPDRPTTQTAGKINWERMIKDYMENKPYSEFEFSGDRPLTLYRSQVYAILKDFGRMKPQQKVNIILNTFGDKYAMVDYIDKLRSKGMMPKKVPAYVSPNVEPVPPGQMSFPGMASPKIKEAEAQKKNSNQTELGAGTARSPKVQRAFQLARARQAAAGTDIEAFVKDELEKAEQAQAEIEQLRGENDRQDQQIQQLATKVRQQDQEINQIQQPTAAAPAKAEPPKEKPKATEPDKKPKAKDAEPKAAEKSAEPARRNEPRAEPAPAKAEKPPKVDQPKPDDTQIQRPRPEPVEVPDNVLQFPTTAQRKKKKKAAAAQDDPMAAAMQGVDIADFGRAVGMNESSEELHMGDPVIIRGNVEHSGKTGDVAGFGRDKHFVIVDLYNFGKHAFHASNVEYNNHDDYIDENQRMDKFNIAQPIPGGSNKQREEFLNARDRLFRQMANASPGEKEAIRLKIAELEGRAQSQGIRIRENNLDEFVTPQAVAQDPSLEREKDVDVVVFGRIPQDFHAEQLVDALEELLPAEYPPGGDWRHQDRSQHGPAPRKMFEVLKQGGAVVTNKPLSVAKKLVAAFNAYGIKSRIDSPGVTEADDLNRSGYNAIKTVGDWAEKMRVMRELQKDIALMSDPEAKAAVQQRIGDLLKVGIKQGYIKEALNDKAMAVLRGLKNQTQATQSTALNPAQQAEVDAWAQDFQRNVAGPMGRQIVPVPAQAPIDLNVPDTPKARRGRPSNAERAQRHQEFLDIKRRLDQLNELIRIKEQIDKLFIKAQNVRGGIYPGLRSDIEAEELYPVPETDQQFQDLLAKYTKDLAALQKFLAMKKAVYREDEDSMLGESTALVRLKQARQALSQQGLNEYAPGQSGGGSGNYFQALASAWYNGAFDTGSLQKGIKSKEDVERLLNRGIIGPDGVTRKYAIDYNSDFDGVVISSDDYYEHSDYNDQGQEVDSRNGQPWGPNDYMEFSDDDLSESVSEGRPEDLPGIDYPRPGDAPRQPRPQGSTAPRRHPDDPDFMDPDQRRLRADQERVKKAWAEKNKGVAEAQTDYQKRRQRERDVDAGRPVKPLPKNPQTDYAKKRAKDQRDMELGEKKDSSPGKITKSEDPCWTGYHMVGKKKKNGREVPNCVPGKKG